MAHKRKAKKSRLHAFTSGVRKLSGGKKSKRMSRMSDLFVVKPNTGRNKQMRLY